MLCPKCGGKTSVTESAADKDYVYRRRTCRTCGSHFFTEEMETLTPALTKQILSNLRHGEEADHGIRDRY